MVVPLTQRLTGPLPEDQLRQVGPAASTTSVRRATGWLTTVLRGAVSWGRAVLQRPELHRAVVWDDMRKIQDLRTMVGGIGTSAGTPLCPWRSRS